jgi:predicted pyridoxine 5'-phosphate oxidase superfamily flavin-nucleotide-binding protein
MTHDDLAAHARAIIDANRYLTLGTADGDGRPWTSRLLRPCARAEVLLDVGR